jgi:hypothetical protein
MLDTTKVRHESDATSLPESGPRCAVPLGHLLAERLPQGSMGGTKTATMTGDKQAQDTDSDND